MITGLQGFSSGGEKWNPGEKSNPGLVPGLARARQRRRRG
jgi:hypothetical protein